MSRRSKPANKHGCKPDGDVCVQHDMPLECRHGCTKAAPHKCKDAAPQAPYEPRPSTPGPSDRIAPTAVSNDAGPAKRDSLVQPAAAASRPCDGCGHPLMCRDGTARCYLAAKESGVPRASIYIASRRKNAERLRNERAQGVKIISSWIDEKKDRSQQGVWVAAFDEIAKCDAFIFYDGGDGAKLELGIAIGMCVPLVIVIGPCDEWTLPCVLPMKDFDAAVNLADSRIRPDRTGAGT